MLYYCSHLSTPLSSPVIAQDEGLRGLTVLQLEDALAEGPDIVVHNADLGLLAGLPPDVLPGGWEETVVLGPGRDREDRLEGQETEQSQDHLHPDLNTRLKELGQSDIWRTRLSDLYNTL